MPLEILTIPCREDNYAFLLHDPGTGTTGLVDAPEAAPILAALGDKGWSLDRVLLTHHHYDHVDGLAELQQHHSPVVIGNAADASRLPKLDIALNDGDSVEIGGETGVMFDVSGHTVGHVAFHFPGSQAVFTADSLMAFGCGRVFEGTMPQMWDSLSKIAALPRDTIVYSGHEYTQSNARFALSIDPDNPKLQARAAAVEAARAKDLPTVPSPLAEELVTNPFLLPSDPDFAARIGMQGADPAEIFAHVRKAKDAF